MKSPHYSLTILSLLTLLVLAGSCSLNKASNSTKPNPALEKKKKHDQLYQELSRNALKAGTLAAMIREKFGDPDDIFKSGSSTSSFEIWTYEKILASKEGKFDSDPILLYFDNSQLVTWKY